MRILCLVIVYGSGKGEVWTLGEGQMLVGRGDGVEIRLHDDRVSREHARITIDGDHILLEDLGSKNGTFCNGQLLCDARELMRGDEIAIGNTVLRLALRTQLDDRTKTGIRI